MKEKYNYVSKWTKRYERNEISSWPRSDAVLAHYKQNRIKQERCRRREKEIHSCPPGLHRPSESPSPRANKHNGEPCKNGTNEPTKRSAKNHCWMTAPVDDSPVEASVDYAENVCDNEVDILCNLKDLKFFERCDAIFIDDELTAVTADSTHCLSAGNDLSYTHQ